jgi:hypothetical protein
MANLIEYSRLTVAHLRSFGLLLAYPNSFKDVTIGTKLKDHFAKVAESVRNHRETDQSRSDRDLAHLAAAIIEIFPLLPSSAQAAQWLSPLVQSAAELLTMNVPDFDQIVVPLTSFANKFAQMSVGHFFEHFAQPSYMALFRRILSCEGAAPLREEIARNSALLTSMVLPQPTTPSAPQEFALIIRTLLRHDPAFLAGGGNLLAALQATWAAIDWRALEESGSQMPQLAMLKHARTSAKCLSIHVCTVPGSEALLFELLPALTCRIAADFASVRLGITRLLAEESRRRAVLERFLDFAKKPASV